MSSEIILTAPNGATARLIHGDCYDFLPHITGDALISDPQYQLANGSKAMTNFVGSRRGFRTGLKAMIPQPRDWGTAIGDDAPFDPAPFLSFGKVILWGAIHYSTRLPLSTAWLIWDKRENVVADDNADGEMAWTNLKGPARIHRQLWKGVCRRGEENISTSGAKLHTFQKPVKLMSWCLERAKITPGQTVFDPFMGSASTGVACLRAGVHFIGVEKDDTHFATAKARIEREIAKLNTVAPTH